MLSLGGAESVADAFAELDLLVSIDLYRNATAEVAHVVLPATDLFERPDLNTFTQGVQATPHIQLTEAVVEPRGGAPARDRDLRPALRGDGRPRPRRAAGVEGLAAAYDGDLAEHGLSVAALAERDRGLAVLDGDATGTFLAERLMTPDGRIDCAPGLIVEAMERSRAILDEMEAEPADRLRLITRRTRTTLNSAMANIGRLKDRGAATNPLWMHPDDAEARGLAAGDLARVSNDVGTVEAPVALDPDLRPGVVAMTHGFGFAANPSLPVAHSHPGVNVNVLSPSGPGTFDPLSGMSHLTGIPVDVQRAALV